VAVVVILISMDGLMFFFPYVGEDLVLNNYCFNYDINEKRGPDVVDFPAGISVAPVKWDYLGQEIPLQFKAGFVGIEQDEKELTLKSVIGWYIEEPPNVADEDEAQDDY